MIIFIDCVFIFLPSAAGTLVDFTIRVGYENDPNNFQANALCHYQGAALGESETRIFPCVSARYGRYVIIQIQATGYLTICEVDVYEGMNYILILVHYLLLMTYVITCVTS
jgi:hypothetical protein